MVLGMKFLSQTLGGLVLGLSITTPSHASTVDWTTVTLSGAFPNYSFTDSSLGLVTIEYSTDSEIYGLRTLFGSRYMLTLGDTGGESLTISWSNSVVGLDIPIWDIDAVEGTIGESVSLATTANVSPLSLHSTDVWDASTLTLSSDGTSNPNQNLLNFSVLRFFDPAGFNSITFNFDIAGGYTGGMGVGNMTVSTIPVPAAIWLFGSGLVGLIGLARRKKS